MLNDVLAVGKLASEAKVRDLERLKAQLGGTEQKIFRLNVTVNNAHVVAVPDRVNNSLDAIASVVLRELLDGKDLVEQLATGHKLHDEAPMSVVLKDVVKSHNVRMIDLLENVYLVHKGLHIIFRHFPFRHDLDGESLASSAELCFFDACVSSSADRRLNLVSLLDVTIV